MPNITNQTLDELLKRQYAGGPIVELSNLTAPALAFAAREGNAQLGGSGFFGGVRTQANHGYAFISPGQALPASRQSKVRQWVVQPVVFAGVVTIEGLAKAISQTNAMAFAKAFDENMQSLLKAMTVYKETALFRDGSGLVATFVDNPGGGSAGPYVMNDVGWIKEGQVFDIVDATLTTRHLSDVKVLAVDWVNKTLLFDQAIPVAVDPSDRLFVADSQADTGVLVNKEPLGLEAALLSTGTYNGIDRALEGNWRATTVTASKFFDEQILMSTRTRIHQETGMSLQEMGSSFGVLCHPMQLDILFRLCIPRIHYMAGQGFELGHDGSFTFGGIRFYTTYNCPPGTAYIGNWADFETLHVPGNELHIDTEYNGSAFKWVQGFDAGTAFAKEYLAFNCPRPISFARIVSLTEAAR